MVWHVVQAVAVRDMSILSTVCMMHIVHRLLCWLLLLLFLPKNLVPLIFRKQVSPNSLMIAVVITKWLQHPLNFPACYRPPFSIVHQKGVAVLGLPGDITNLPAVEAETTTRLFLNKPIVRPSDEELAQLAELLNSHKKITIYCGLGSAKAHDEVVALAERLKFRGFFV